MAIEDRLSVRSHHMTRLAVFLATLVTASLHARPPNVILIMADDLGYEAIAANGGEGAKTPHLDKLAQEGVRFDACHVQPLCTPTRTALMTGMVNARNYTHFGHMDPAQVTFGSNRPAEPLCGRRHPSGDTTGSGADGLWSCGKLRDRGAQ